jgi:hypothetical protein
LSPPEHAEHLRIAELVSLSTDVPELHLDHPRTRREARRRLDTATTAGAHRNTLVVDV